MIRMHRVLLLVGVLSVLLMLSNAIAECTGSTPTWTTTPDYASVSSCVSRAANGDTIRVLAGTATWGSRLSITRSVQLIGAGVGQTVINNSYSPSLAGGTLDATKHLISVVPSSPETNPMIRVSGFTLNFGSSSYGIYYGNSSTAYDCTNVRFDHLDISASAYVFQRYGLAHGVMDNCTIKGLMDGGGSSGLWSSNGYEFGTDSNFYIEDCVWLPYSDSSSMHQAGNGALRYAFRHNSITIPSGRQVFPLFDQHGNQYNAQASCFGAEIYENVISMNGNNWATLFFDQRGGKSLVYNNTIAWTTGGGVWTRIREEHQDTDGAGAAINPVNGQPQHISDSYYWGNTKNGSPLIPSLVNELGVSDSISGQMVPGENLHVWLEKSPFDGTSGVGVGLSSARPPTCVKGVGYWATDEKKLYRCAKPDAWVLYYTPYTYPHPLRTTTTLRPPYLKPPTGG